ncbi:MULTISPECIES: hypothetical protein [Paenibacillus]|uniref:hypothetical protein n=1 Tax=Paenibacillus TaxID=44249 RepID=UPI0015959A9D|nr:hypothetical protein [Paenibacillus sp. 7523-1]
MLNKRPVSPIGNTESYSPLRRNGPSPAEVAALQAFSSAAREVGITKQQQKPLTNRFPL